MADCCATLANIEKACGGGNAAGLKTQLHLSCIDDVATIPARDNYPTTGAPHTVSGNITMETGKVFKLFNFSAVDAEFTVEPEGDAEFITYLIRVKIVIPKLSPLTTYILNGITGGQFVLLPTDKNGHRRLVGDKEEGARPKVTESTVDRNRYEVVFELRSKELPLFYTGTIPT